jgi:flagellar basal-body rod protein FlgB
MTQPIETLTAATLNLALDAAQMRQQAFARNIANVHSSGYARQQVSFEDQLAPLRAAAEQQRLQPGQLAGVQPRLRSEPVAPVLDEEMAQMAGNAVQYQSLLKLLSRHYALLALAVADGKR